MPTAEIVSSRCQIELSNPSLTITAVFFEQTDKPVPYSPESGCSEPDWCGGTDLNTDSVVDLRDFGLLDGCCVEVIEE